MDLKKDLKRTLRMFKSGTSRHIGEVQNTFNKELVYQANTILLFASLISLSWLSYIPIDLILHPDKPLIIALRIGFPVIGISVLLLRFIFDLEKYGLLLLTIIGGYLEIATGLITGLTGGDAVYVGGYLFIIILLAVVPLRRKVAWSILLISISLFFVVAFYNGFAANTTAKRYSLNDLISTTVVAFIFIYIVDMIRHKSWLKSKKIKEQSQIIEKDKEKIDELLLNILPKSIAQEIKEKGKVKPVHFESATVLFTDFVGFTQIAESMDPETLVGELDKAFSFFDSIMDKYNLEKLKTIGDSYMCAGGVPKKNNTHHIDTILAAFEIVRYMENLKKEKKIKGEQCWELRIGINTGSLMAGVVGDKKFVYDIWGDSVNVASRLESSGESGKVNISGETYKYIKNFFNTELRGMIAAKNKGTIEMYFVNGIKADLSIDGNGVIPNDKFYKLYNERKIGG